jgi:hypothetical protein
MPTRAAALSGSERVTDTNCADGDDDGQSNRRREEGRNVSRKDRSMDA